MTTPVSSPHPNDPYRPDGVTVGQPPEPRPNRDTAKHELSEWWESKAHDEIEMVVDKAIEYGSTDLEDVGHALARMQGRKVSDAEAAEMGIMFYVRGKMARWESAIANGRVASADTLLDIGVYVRMAQRVRDSGGWPGTKEILDD